MFFSYDQEANLAQRAKHGDDEAFDKLWKLHETAIRGFIRNWLWTDRDHNPGLVDELQYDTWISLKEKINTYDPDTHKSNFRAFAIFWAKIMLKRYFRREGRYRQFEMLAKEFTEPWEDDDSGESSLEDSDLSPLDIVTMFELFENTLKTTLTEGGYPHQIIVFLFRWLGWKPREIAKELSEALLRPLEERLERDYRSESGTPENYVRDRFQPLRENMSRRVHEAITDRVSLDLLKEILEKLVGDTILQNYYSEVPEDSIYNWIYRVKLRVLKEMIDLTPDPE